MQIKIKVKNTEFNKMKKKMRYRSNLIKELKNKTVLITGGAGSIGSALTKKLLEFPIRAVRVLDVNEHALFLLKRSVNDRRLRPFLGSVLDQERVDMASNNVDIIIHTAAVKNIEITEFNPIETIEVNTIGTVNLIKTAIKINPKKFLNISTDKAVEPTTLYGTTKQLSERLTSWAGATSITTKFATIRFGNVIESRGNVFEIWQNELKNNKPLSITDQSMRRYFFHLDEAVDAILESLPLIDKGEIIVPKMKVYSIKDLASKISKKHNLIGKRQGEKISEVLLSKTERKNAIERKNLWIIKPYTKNF